MGEPDGGMVLPPPPLPLTRLPLVSSVKKKKLQALASPPRCRLLGTQTLPAVPARAAPGCAGNPLYFFDFCLEAWAQRVSCI